MKLSEKAKIGIEKYSNASKASGFIPAKIVKLQKGGVDLSEKMGMDIASGNVYLMVKITDSKMAEEFGMDGGMVDGDFPASKLKGFKKGDMVQVKIKDLGGSTYIQDVRK